MYSPRKHSHLETARMKSVPGVGWGWWREMGNFILSVTSLTATTKKTHILYVLISELVLLPQMHVRTFVLFFHKS